jgi:hypothetical protein
MLSLAVRSLAFIAVLFTLSTPALAQDDHRFALVASFPSPTVSVQWEANERLGFRVDASYSFSDESTEYGFGGQEILAGLRLPSSTSRIERASHTGSIGLVGLVTLRRTDRIRLYLAPRVFLGFSRQTTEEDNDFPDSASIEHVYANGTRSQVFFLGSTGPASVETSSTTPGAGLSFGVRSKVVDQLALFGEAGFSFSRSNNPTSGPASATLEGLSILSTAESRRTTVSTRAVAGVMFLF